MKTWALVIGLLALLAAALWAIASAWTSAGIEIGLFGWLVIGAGALLSVLLGAGLMALVFFSARRGFDDPPDGPSR